MFNTPTLPIGYCLRTERTHSHPMTRSRVGKRAENDAHRHSVVLAVHLVHYSQRKLILISSCAMHIQCGADLH